MLPMALYPPTPQQGDPPGQQVPVQQPMMYPAMFFLRPPQMGGGLQSFPVGWPARPPSDYSEIHFGGARPDLLVASAQPKVEVSPVVVQPDVVQQRPAAQGEPFYTNDVSEPLYVNNTPPPPERPATADPGPRRVDDEQPMYANDQERGSFPRGASLPPMVCDELFFAPPNADPDHRPAAPPRSRRGSTLSMAAVGAADSSLDLTGLVQRFQDLKRSVDALKIGEVEPASVGDGAAVAEPRRPPRRKDRFKRRAQQRGKDFSTLPRNFKTKSLGVINEDTFNQAEREEVSILSCGKPLVPMPGTVTEPASRATSAMSSIPVVAMPGTTSAYSVYGGDDEDDSMRDILALAEGRASAASASSGGGLSAAGG